MDARLAHVAVAAALLVSSAPALHAERLPLKTYTTADGLARDQIIRIVRDPSGLLWFGTFEGLSRFDGAQFKTYSRTDGLPGGVRDILITRAGAYWLATSEGVYRLDPLRTARNGMFTAYYPASDAEARNVHALAEDPNGDIWCGTSRGAFRLRETKGSVTFTPVDFGMPQRTIDDPTVDMLLVDRSKSLWVGTRGSGLYRRRADGEVEHYTTRDGLPGDRVSALLEDNAGRLWAGTTAGLAILTAASDAERLVVSRVYTTRDGLPGNWISDILQTSEGRIWVGTAAGLGQFVRAETSRRSSFRAYTLVNGLSDPSINALAEDRDGNLWIGSDSGGMKLARGGLVSFTEADGLAPTGAGSIFETRAGDLCASDKNVIRCFDGERFITIRPRFPPRISYFGWGWSQLTVQDKYGEYWLPTGQGLFRFPRTARIEHLAETAPKAAYTVRDGLVSDDVFRLFEDSRGDIWISTFSLVGSGITRWQRSTNTLHLYSDRSGLPSIHWVAEAFGEDRRGNIWIGLGSVGLARFSDHGFSVFGHADGVPAGLVRGLHVDHAGRLWIATDRGGVGRVDHPEADRLQLRTYTTADGLSTNETWTITEDRQGRIYIGTGRGVDRVDLQRGTVRHFTTADGLVSNWVIASFRDSAGSLWFGSARGLSRLTPEPDAALAMPPVFISGVHVRGIEHPVSEFGAADIQRLPLGAADNHIRIDFFGVSFGERLHYQYRLDRDRDWGPATDQRAVEYANLAPGVYRFSVRAIAADGSVSPSPATIAFTIAFPIWRRWWFIALVAVATVGIAFTLYHARVTRLVALERVRSRIAADLHDGVGASLSRIAILSEVVRQQAEVALPNAIPALTAIGKNARDVIDDMSDAVWFIDPRLDTLQHVIARLRVVASELFDGSTLRWAIDTSENASSIALTADQRRHVYLALKEALTNVLRHARATHLTVQITASRGRLRIEVRDDGTGLTGGQGSSNRGRGLDSMHSRAAALRGTLTIVSGEGGRGTSLVFEVPIA